MIPNENNLKKTADNKIQKNNYKCVQVINWRNEFITRDQKQRNDWNREFNTKCENIYVAKATLNSNDVRELKPQ